MKNFAIRLFLLILFIIIFSGCSLEFDFPDDFDLAESLKTEVNQPEFGKALDGLQTAILEVVSAEDPIKIPISTETQQPHEANPTVVPTYTPEGGIFTPTLRPTDPPRVAVSVAPTRVTVSPTPDPLSSPTTTSAFSSAVTLTPIGASSLTPSWTNTPIPAVKTAIAVFTPSSPTSTSVAPVFTATDQPPTATSILPVDTETPLSPTNTNIPPSATSVPPSNTPVPSVCSPSGNTSLESQIINLVNVERANAGLAVLQQQGQLTSAARGHSEDMACNNFFSHTSPTTGSPFDRMSAAGYSYSWAGENIAAGYPSAQAVVQGWMNSQGHRDNILNPNFTQIGLGYAYDGGSAYGAYYTAAFGAP